MRIQCLASKQRRKKYQSYKGAYGNIVSDLLKRDFQADAPNQKWVTDVTEFKVKDKKLYLSPVLDLYNREIIAWSMAENPSIEMVEDMLSKAFRKKKKTDNPVLHSDQGWQYQMAKYQRRLKANNIHQSMSRKGNCLDNAVMENFFGILKSECWHGETFKSIEQPKQVIRDYMKYYNNDRIKVKLNGLSPITYRTQATMTSN
jgi:putative transposase